MTLNEYQREASRFALDHIKNDPIYYALGLAEETGEVMEKLKKNIRDGKMDIADFQKELGDCIWYLSGLANCFAMDLEGVAKLNLHKLQSRLDRNVVKGSGDNR